MNSPEQDEQLPVQVRRALAAETEAPSNQTDQNILRFAAARAAGPHTPARKTWMPAAAACCLVGVLTFSLLPEQLAESEKSMDVDIQPAKSSKSEHEVITQNEHKHADTLRAETEAVSTAPKAYYSAGAAPAAPATINHLQLTPKFFERLTALNEQENSANGISAGIAQAKPDSLTAQTSRKRVQAGTESDLSSLLRPKENQNDDHMLVYEALRNECDCGLPDSLQQALHMLAKQQIQSDNSEPPSRDYPQ
ncbi:MAG: hypothetical protein AAF542_02565 [Pseudomonadota bacterium]